MGKVTNSIKIRMAVSKDKSAILSVIGSYRQKWDRPIAKKYYDVFFSTPECLKGDTVYVAVLHNKIVGVSGYFIDRYETDYYWLGWFYIHKDWARNRYGEQLLKYVIEQLKKKKVKKLFVNTSSAPFYKGALAFYKRNGFKREAVIKNYYWNGEHQIILSKKL